MMGEERRRQRGAEKEEGAADEEGKWGSIYGHVSACSAGDEDWLPGSGRSLKGGAAHSSILAWKVPWTEEPGRLQSRGSKRDSS